MGAEKHATTIGGRWLPPSGFAWRRRRRASCTSAACARSCSTGSSRGSRAASACCGSRTPTRAARSPSRSSRSSARSRWLGIDWDGPVTFQLDVMDDCREAARRLVEEGKAYEDEGAIRFRMPDEGTTGWDDAVNGCDRVPERAARGRRARPLRRPADLQLRLAVRGLRSTGSRTSSAATTTSRTRRSRSTSCARSAPSCRVYAHAPSLLGAGRQEALEAPRRAVDRRVPRRGLRRAGADELPRAARLELRRQDDGHVARRADRALLARARAAEPGDVRLREARLAERRLPPRAVAGRVRARAGRSTSASTARLGRGAGAPDGAARAGEDHAPRRVSPTARASLPTTSSRIRRCSTRTCSRGRARCSRRSRRGTAAAIEAALRDLAERLGLKPGQGLPADPRSPSPARRSRRACSRASSCSAATRRSGGCVARLRRSGLGGPSGSSARWNCSHARLRKRRRVGAGSAVLSALLGRCRGTRLSLSRLPFVNVKRRRADALRAEQDRAARPVPASVERDEQPEAEQRRERAPARSRRDRARREDLLGGRTGRRAGWCAGARPGRGRSSRGARSARGRARRAIPRRAERPLRRRRERAPRRSRPSSRAPRPAPGDLLVHELPSRAAASRPRRAPRRGGGRTAARAGVSRPRAAVLIRRRARRGAPAQLEVDPETGHRSRVRTRRPGAQRLPHWPLDHTPL